VVAYENNIKEIKIFHAYKTQVIDIC
jgi:hypothetical protein